MTVAPRVLVLGGTGEARALDTALAARFGGSIDLVVSLAGRTTTPVALRGQVRIGGFGGIDGLRDHLVRHRVVAVVDALHPFAAVMAAHAVAACRSTATPLVKVVRPPWVQQAGDRWTRVATMADAPAALAGLGANRVLLTVGRQDLDPFRAVAGTDFLVRSIEAADLAGGWSATALLARGPFTVEAEVHLLRTEAVDALVTKDSGGPATAAKLTAARQLGIDVVVVDRPPVPDVAVVATVDDAVDWLSRVLGAGPEPAAPQPG